jgi:hypothetical protein
MKFNDKVPPGIVFLLCVGAIGIPFLLAYYNGKNYDKAIRTNSSLTVGKVYGYTNPRKQSQSLQFEFEFDGKTFYGSSSCSDFGWRTFEGSYNKLYPLIKGRFLPVFFSKDDPTKYSKILVTAADFKEYDIIYPDSLQWIERILKGWDSKRR